MKYMLTISIGPVQDFIATARKTRDLWYGSYLLSEVSKAAANSVFQDGGYLIFPAVKNGNELSPNSDLIVTNKILSILPEHLDPEEVFQRAETKAKGCFFEEAKEVYQKLNETGYLDEKMWTDQINDFLEIYGAWVLYEDLQESRVCAERLLAGRKVLRDFGPNTGAKNVFKSSLDGKRESVLKNDFPKNQSCKVGLRENEYLDAIGFIKRLGQGYRQYPSVPRIAADSWIRMIDKSENEKYKVTFQQFVKCVGQIPSYPKLDVEKYPQYALFPYAGGVCYKQRLKEFFSDENDELYFTLRETLEDLPTPSPYMAVLVADGDRMGQIISKCYSLDQLSSLSLNLSLFAEESQKIIAKHNGSLVYAGGDDVLAFLPLDTCFVAAAELSNAFITKVGQSVENCQPTLSVGVTINHFLDPLSDILERARNTEGFAKERGRNGLAVTFYKRSGGDPIRVFSKWSNNPVNQIEAWISLFKQKSIPHKLAYELHELFNFYNNFYENSCNNLKFENVEEALFNDVSRLIKRKDVANKDVLEQMKTLLFLNMDKPGEENLKVFESNVLLMLLAEHVIQQFSGEQEVF